MNGMKNLNKLMLRDIAEKVEQLRNMIKQARWINGDEEEPEKEGGDPTQFES